MTRRTLALLRGRQGIAALEFALVAPAMILMLLGLYDLSTAMWRRTRLEMAARAGAQHAFLRPADSAGIAAAVRGQLAGWQDVTVGPTTMSCRCDNGAAADCATGTCASAIAPIGYVSIAVSQPYRHISPVTAALLPGLATLRGNAEVRVR